MKYRRLELTELEVLEKEFIQFLAANHITAPDWEKIKKEDHEQMNGLLDIFSDVVFDKTLEKLEYLEFIAPDDIKTFFCDKDQIYLLGLKHQSGRTVNFQEIDLSNDLIELIKDSSISFEIYSAEKSYQPERKQELFRMIESGCLISREGTLYKTLDKWKVAKKS